MAGCIVTGGLFFLVAWVSHTALGRTGLGGGDIKLAGLIGAALGAGGGMVAAFVGIMLGGVVAAGPSSFGAPAIRRVPAIRPLPGRRRGRGGRLGPPLLEWYLG